LSFAFSHEVRWTEALITASGPSLGGVAGAMMLKSFDQGSRRIAVTAIGVLLTVGLFLKA